MSNRLQQAYLKKEIARIREAVHLKNKDFIARRLDAGKRFKLRWEARQQETTREYPNDLSVRRQSNVNSGNSSFRVAGSIRASLVYELGDDGAI